MSASIGNFQFELESSLEAAKSAGVFSNLLKDKSEDVILEAFKGHTKIKDIEWIAVYFENCHKLNTKSSEKASCLRNEGNKLFQKKKYREAISKYTHAIISGPTETEELAFAYGNRSAALYRIGLYEECLSDIEEVFSCGSPSALQHKLLLRKAQCMNHLGCTAETNLCLGELQHELEDLDLDADKKGNILSEMAALQDRHELRGNTMKTEKAVEVHEVSYGPNSVLVQASGLVSLNSSKTKGRFLTASKDVKAGDTLIVERPFAAVLLPDHYPTHCHHCFQKLNMAYPCRQCTMVRYCSAVCATLSWDQYHNVECRYLQLLHSVGIAHLSLRVVLVAGCRYLLEFMEKQKTDKSQNVAGLDIDGQYRGDYQSVYHLMTHADHMAVEDLFQYTMTAELLLEILRHSGWLCCETGQTEFTTVESCIGGLLLRHILQLVCNAHAITELQCSQQDESNMVEEKSQVRIATAIYPTASLMNHSCDPTIISSFCKNILVVRAVKEVHAGEEIFNCYGPHHKRMGWSERQQCLKEQYFFDCQCKPCLDGEATEAVFLSYRCQSCSGPMVKAAASHASHNVCQQCNCAGAVDKTKAEKADDLFQQGLSYLKENKMKEAITVLDECYTVRKTVLYKHNKLLAEVQDCLARCYAMTGDFKNSVKYLRESIDTVEVMFGKNSIELANELQKLSEALIGAQDWKEALTANEMACCIFERNYGKSHDTVQELSAAKKQLLQLLSS